LYKFAFLPLALAACTASIPVPEDTPGVVHQFDGDSVIIRGAFEPDRLATETAKPTQRMIEQAQEVCPGARFVGAAPSHVSPYYISFLFQFRC
jgi:hypothetical protein